MSIPDNELDLDKLFLPAWAQEPASANLYAKYEGEATSPRDRDRRGPRRGGPPGARRPGPRRDGPPRDGSGPPRGERPSRPGERRENRPPGQGQSPSRGRDGRGDRRGPRRDQPREHRPPPPPLPEINLTLTPDDKGVDSLARQIKMTGRAYPLFEIAQMILQRPERNVVAFEIRKNAEGKPVQPLFLCALDETLWLSEDEAIGHVLQKHFGTFYQAERTATEPPKGKYTFVAQCGMSGITLGPPNYHDYQNQLRKLHSERFSRMPFDLYKSRVKIVRDEEVVKKWVEGQSWKTEYICLNLPEPVRLATMEAVEKHFRETHKENIIKPVESHTLAGTAARSLRSPDLVRLVRTVWDDQKRFPLQVATVLSQQFATRGLQFFKVNKAITHVSVARPHYLDLEATPVSEGIKRIVEFINAHPKSTRRHLMDGLAPSPAAPAVIPVEPGTVQGQPAQPAQLATPAEPTPEQTAVISDLHWLVHQGHVIEFANGILETAKKPIPKPAKPQATPEAAPSSQETVEANGLPAAATPETALATEPSPGEPKPTPEDSMAGSSSDLNVSGEAPPCDEGSRLAPTLPVENPPVESPS